MIPPITQQRSCDHMNATCEQDRLVLVKTNYQIATEGCGVTLLNERHTFSQNDLGVPG